MTYTTLTLDERIERINNLQEKISEWEKRPEYWTNTDDDRIYLAECEMKEIIVSIQKDFGLSIAEILTRV